MFELFQRKKKTKDLKTKSFNFSMWINWRSAQKNRNESSYKTEGYMQNAFAFRCVSIIADAISNIKFELVRGDDIVTEHKLIDLLEKPNGAMGYTEFIRAIISDYLITGNSYILRNELEKTDGNLPKNIPPTELHRLPPEQVFVKEGNFGVPSGYEYRPKDRNEIIHFGYNPLDNSSAIMHMKSFNPHSVWYGMSKMEPAAYHIDIFNESQKHNQALLENGAVPSGILSAKDSNMPNLDENDRQRLLESLKNMVEKSGAPILLESGFEWTQLGENMRDLNYLEANKQQASFICIVFGVPSQLMNLPDSQTYSNYEEAKLAFWLETVLPLAGELIDNLNCRLVPTYGEKDLKLRINQESLIALEPLREMMFSRMQKTTFFTENEKRERTGVEPKGAAADELYKSASEVPIDMLGFSESDITGTGDDE